MISVITCPRPGGVRYVAPLLVAVDIVCPGERRFLFCDGINEEREGWETEWLDLRTKIGLRDNKYVGWMAIERAAALGEDLLFLEDDVLPVDVSALLDAVAYEVPSNCAYTSLHRSERMPPGIHGSELFMMSQAVKMPARSLPHLLSWRTTHSGDWEAACTFDVALAVAGRAVQWKYEQTERNYFIHVGEVSAVQLYPGRDLDRLG